MEVRASRERSLISWEKSPQASVAEETVCPASESTATVSVAQRGGPQTAPALLGALLALPAGRLTIGRRLTTCPTKNRRGARRNKWIVVAGGFACEFELFTAFDVRGSVLLQDLFGPGLQNFLYFSHELIGQGAVDQSVIETQR
jgi:hypothetical protein